MVNLLLLVIPLLGVSVEIEAVTVEWPSHYSFEMSQRDESRHYSSNYKYYFSHKDGVYSFREDYYGGTNTAFLTVQGNLTYEIYYYYPTTNDTAANVTNCVYTSSHDFPLQYFSYFPDLSYLTHSANSTVNGAPAQIWKGEQKIFGLLQKVSFWLQIGDQTKGPIPIKVEVKDISREEHASLHAPYAISEIYNYQPEEPNKSVWIHPQNVKCRHVKSDDVGILSTILSNWNGQTQPQTKGRRSRGLKIGNRSLETASPFPYKDEEIRLMAHQLPEVFDWRLHGAVTSVKNQRHCRSCWAFSIVGAMEGSYFRKTGFLGDMSVQALVDCGWWTDPSNGETDGGCYGGNFGSALDWIKNHGGLPWAADYGDYKAINGRCTLNHVKTFGPIKGYVHVKADVEAVKVALYHHGPLTVAISTPDDFESYYNGVFKPSGDPGDVDHAVLLIGYGSLSGEDYWLIKNSWGESWGLRGYGLISTENNTLSLLDNVFYPEMI